MADLKKISQKGQKKCQYFMSQKALLGLITLQGG